jgi:NAD(P)-dependent dehydrogenase (short-subunit alcohol dehydrogenase family)
VNTSRGPAVIVGYGSGVSGAVANEFGREGYPLALIARNESKLNSAVDQLKSSGITAQGFPADAGNAVSLRQALDAVRASFGDAEVLLYNAALWRPGPVLETTTESFDADFQLCVTGGLVAALALAPAMIAAGQGTLLFTGGGLALYPSPQAPSLSVGKAGIRALAKMLAEELAPSGVRVGTVTIAGEVAPGTEFAPEKIAQAFLSIHNSPPDPNTAEIIFRGVPS